MQPALFDSSIYITALRRGDDAVLRCAVPLRMRPFGSVQWYSKNSMPALPSPIVKL